jgi:hypothetical protein
LRFEVEGSRFGLGFRFICVAKQAEGRKGGWLVQEKKKETKRKKTKKEGS